MITRAVKPAWREGYDVTDVTGHGGLKKKKKNHSYLRDVRNFFSRRYAP